MGDARVGRFRKHFRVQVYQNIAACLNERQGVGATILICCAIDLLAKYAAAGSALRGNKARYVAFLTEYFPSHYDAEAFYRLVRCGLVHGFDMGRRYAVLSSNEPWAQKLHMQRPAGVRRTIVNPYRLFKDMKLAHAKLCDRLDADRPFRREFAKIYRSEPVRPQHYRRDQILRWLGMPRKKQSDAFNIGDN